MVSRTQVKNILYDEMLDALGFTFDSGSGQYVDGIVPFENVGTQFPNREEDIPAVVYRDAYRPLVINGASASPHEIERDVNGDVVAEIHREYREAQFTFSVRAGDDGKSEEVYEALHSHFHKFNFRSVADVKDLHEHFFHIRVTQTSYADDGDANVPMRGDTVQVNIHFYREYKLEGDNIVYIEQNVEGNNYNTE